MSSSTPWIRLGIVLLTLAAEAVVACAVVGLAPWAAAADGDDSLVPVSTAASPRVAYSVDRQGDTLVVAVAVEPFAPASTSREPAGGVGVQLGVAADKTLVLAGEKPTQDADGTVRFTFRIPAERLVASPAGWQKLRLAFTVEWQGGPAGQPRQRERFLDSAARSPHAGLSPEPADWQPLDLAEFARAAADRRLAMGFPFTQPLAGKATIVVDDAQGNRVRNLVSGIEMEQGRRKILWDGCDDRGVPQPPGEYRWRSISHPGLEPEFLFDLCNGPGSNHGSLHAAATNGKQLFFGTSVAEGGHELIQLEPDGRFVRGYNSPMGHGLAKVAVAADEKFLYAVYDGTFWGQHVDRAKPDWQAEQKLSLVRFDHTTGNQVDFKPRVRFADLGRYSVGPGSPRKLPDRTALAGMVFRAGRLYVGDAVKEGILDVDPATGEIARTIAVENPIALAADAGGLYAVAGNRLVRIDPATGQTAVIAASLEGRPTGLAVGGDGRFFVSDAEAHVVRVLDPQGTQVGMIGKPGGVSKGAYDPLELHHPAGLVVSPDGHLWVTEEDRWTPKRLAAYDVAKGTMWKEFFGPVGYGASGGGFDPEDATRWIGQGTLFKVDYDKQTAVPMAILGGEPGMHYRFWRQDGRTFVIACGKATFIEELLPDNTLKALACYSSAHLYAYAHRWKPHQEFVAAFRRDYPKVKYDYGQHGQPGHGYGMLWVDRDGDGRMEAAEIEFATAAESCAAAYWGQDFRDLTLRIPAKVAGRNSLVTITPDGWWPGGAPKYPNFNDAVKAAVPIDLPGTVGVESTTDRFGNMILNSDPEMRGFAADGRLLWRYPNRWSGVHGSHAAPLPSPGELQGVLFFTGVTPLDDTSDVMFMNGNHGRGFVMTTDGLYVDEVFPDCRVMTNPQAGGIATLGGECFGGTFGRDRKSGDYLFQGGGLSYRIFRIAGLNKTVRGSGSFTLTPEQAVAAERRRAEAVAAAIAKPAQATIAFTATPPKIDGKGEGWSGGPAATWEKNRQFPVSVRAAHDGTTLYLSYAVKDDASPWVNNGKDWQTLFKTGDSVDFQIGVDAKANPKRSGPVPGDLRLLVAPFESGNIAVLYRHRLPGSSDSVVFQSPWRSEKVDSVKKLDRAQVAVNRAGNGYTVDVAVPLADLGLAPGQPLRGDFGVIYGDAAGTTNVFRSYWSNQATGLVNDVPGEIMLTPALWGDIAVEPKP
jgi:streptogramin lyase